MFEYTIKRANIVKSASRYAQLVALLPMLSDSECKACLLCGDSVEFIHPTFNDLFHELVKQGFDVSVKPLYFMDNRAEHIVTLHINTVLATHVFFIDFMTVMRPLCPHVAVDDLRRIHRQGGAILMPGYEKAHLILRILKSMGYVGHIDREKVRL